MLLHQAQKLCVTLGTLRTGVTVDAGPSRRPGADQGLTATHDAGEESEATAPL